MSKMAPLCDDAIDYVLGGLGADQRKAVEVSRALDIDLDLALSNLENGLVPLFVAGPDLAPPSALWDALEVKLDASAAKIDRKQDGVWAQTAPGVMTKLLWDGRSLLIQCEAGAIVPEHEHFADERIIVLSGDMIVDDRSFTSGDTVWMAKATQHGQTTTRTGCLILISYVN